MFSLHTQADNGNHRTHSDTLLLLLQQKLRIQSLQKDFVSLNQPAARKNIGAQSKALTKAMSLLNQYVQVPESHYRNAEEYASSLQNRAEIMDELTQLMRKHWSQIQQVTQAPIPRSPN